MWSADLYQYINLTGGIGQIYVTGNSSTNGLNTGSPEVMYAMGPGGDENYQNNGIFSDVDWDQVARWGDDVSVIMVGLDGPLLFGDAVGVAMVTTTIIYDIIHDNSSENGINNKHIALHLNNI